MTETPYTFEARCKDCRRLLGEVEIERDHQARDVVFKTKCRTTSCRGRVIEVRFHREAAAGRAQIY